MISVITGPSRTGDIERILVLVAHGPRRLTVLCVVAQRIVLRAVQHLELL